MSWPVEQTKSPPSECLTFLDASVSSSNRDRFSSVPGALRLFILARGEIIDRSRSVGLSCFGIGFEKWLSQDGAYIACAGRLADRLFLGDQALSYGPETPPVTVVNRLRMVRVVCGGIS